MKFRITIDDRLYEADLEIVEDEIGGLSAPRAAMPAFTPSTYSSPPPPLAPASPAANASSASPADCCISNVMGVVVRLLVQEGDAVTEGDPVVVVEAMKMESTFTAPRTGKVKRILVAPGDGVKRGQALLELA